MSRTLYFDESSHDRKIQITNDNTLNIWKKDRKSDKYVGCFVGWLDHDIEQVKQDYLEFENNVRAMFGMPEDKEIKSQIVPERWYQNGLASFGKHQLQFYYGFFEFLKDTDAFWQANIASKIDLFLRRGLRFGSFRYKIPDEVIMYTLVKFFDSYADDNLLAAVSKYCNNQLMGYQCRKAIIARLNEVIEYNQGSKLKVGESAAYKELIRILKKFSFSYGEPTVEFDYSVDGFGLASALTEYGISKENVSILVDKEQHTYESIHRYFPNVSQIDSTECFGVRAADLLSGFIARMIHSLCAETSRRSPVLEGEHASEKKLWVSETWFDLRNKPAVFDLYKRIASVMVGDNLSYWTVCASNYADEVSCFFSLLRYFRSIPDFQDYLKYSAADHRQSFNTFAVQELSNRLG